MKDTKKNILEVAVDMFANSDFDSVSTRDIAEKANVNLSAISYYFGSKEGLYIAVVKKMIDVIKESNKSLVNSILNFKFSQSQEENVKSFLNIMGEFVEYAIINNNNNRDSIIWSKNNSRIALVLDIVYNDLHLPLNNAFAKIIASITNLSVDDIKTVFVVNSIIGQLIEILINKDMILKTLNIEVFDTKQLNILKDVVIRQTEAIINLYR